VLDTLTTINKKLGEFIAILWACRNSRNVNLWRATRFWGKNYDVLFPLLFVIQVHKIYAGLRYRSLPNKSLKLTKRYYK